MLQNFVPSMRRHDWVTSITEFVLLILGIVLGFQLDRWNSDRLDHKEADEYSVQLLDDLAFYQREVELRVACYETVKAFGLKALTAWEGQSEYSPEELVIAFYQASNIIPTSTIRGGYDTHSSKGLTALIDGPEFASRLAVFYAQPLDEFLESVSNNSPYDYVLKI